MTAQEHHDNKITGDVGLYYVCYNLAMRGWNVLPTSRNTRGVDIVIFSQDGKRRHTIEVKTLSKEDYIHGIMKPLLSDFYIVCADIRRAREKNRDPQVFVASREEYEGGLQEDTTGKQGGKSYFLKSGDYKQFTGGWGLIGEGTHT